MAEASQDGIADSIVVTHGLAEPEPDAERLTETGNATLEFRGATAQLGDAVVRLAEPVSTSVPGVRRTVKAELTSRGLGIEAQPMDFVERIPSEGLPFAGAPAPGDRILELEFAALPMIGAVDRIVVRSGLPPEREEGALVETAAASREFEGNVGRLGLMRAEVWSLSGEPGRLVVILTNPGLDAANLLLELRETGAGSLLSAPRC